MSRSVQSTRGPIAVALALVLLIGRVANGEHEATPRPTEGEAKVRTALAEKTEFDFVQRPLTEVAEAVGERHHIEVQLDRSRLEDEKLHRRWSSMRGSPSISKRSATWRTSNADTRRLRAAVPLLAADVVGPIVLIVLIILTILVVRLSLGQLALGMAQSILGLKVIEQRRLA